jgi:DNA-binding CsgD family transcriptional regulator
MEGKKKREIAEQLDISAETVKVQKRRAIARLRDKLSPMLIEIILVLIRKSFDA